MNDDVALSVGIANALAAVESCIELLKVPLADAELAAKRFNRKPWDEDRSRAHQQELVIGYVGFALRKAKDRLDTAARNHERFLAGRVERSTHRGAEE